MHFRLTFIFLSLLPIRFVFCDDDDEAFGKMIDDLAFGVDDLGVGDNIFSNGGFGEQDELSNAFGMDEPDINPFENTEDFELFHPEANTTGDSETDFQSFIINGDTASKGEYPWFSTISIVKGSYISTICGGTLIHRNWVLTAAHCIERYRYGVEVGKYKAGIKAVYRNVDFVCRHKFYNQATIDNDIALLHFKTPITGIKPIRFSAPQSKPMNVIGFGSTNVNANGGYPTTLQEATVYRVDEKKCARAWGDFVDNRKICASGNGYQDSCVGDSGGPLVMRTQYGIRQVGLVSFGPVPCNDPKFPVIYTRVKTMRHWISSVINGDKSFCTVIKA